MTTAAETPEPLNGAGRFVPDMAVTSLAPSKTNPRKHFDPTKLQELADSLKEHGVVEPLIVRRQKGSSSQFEIVAGERRYRASKLAGLDQVPVLERQLSDEQVIEIQLVENIQRDDLTALEQARGYKALIASNPGKHTAASIATRVGMSEAWVWDRLKLNDLIPEAKELLEQERMSTGHAILIARQKPEDQKRIISPASSAYNNRLGGLWRHSHAELDLGDAKKAKEDKYHGLTAVSVRELESWIAENIRFDVAHAAKAVPLQFETVAAQVEQAAAQPGRGKKVIPITFSYHVAEDARDADERTYSAKSFERADGQEKSKTCEHSVLGVVVAGTEHYGQTRQVCVARDKCRVHFGDVIRQKEKNEKLRATGQASKANARESADRKRQEKADADRRAKEERWKAFKPALEKAVLAAVGKVKALTHPQFAAVVKANRLPANTKPANLAKALLEQAVEASFRYAYFESEAGKLMAWAKLLGVDVKACEPKPAKETA